MGNVLTKYPRYPHLVDEPTHIRPEHTIVKIQVLMGHNAVNVGEFAAKLDRASQSHRTHLGRHDI
jgi:hypothetical protein